MGIMMAASFFLIFLMGLSYASALSAGLASEKDFIEADKKMAEDEIRRKKAIVVKLEKFLSEAEFLVPIAKWRNESIYKYVRNGNVVYEFEDVMSKESDRMGMDDENLCFKQMAYRRITAEEVSL